MTTGAAPLAAASPSDETVDACGAFMAASVTKDAYSGATSVPLWASAVPSCLQMTQPVDLYGYFSF
jgi:hypothetical protein